MRNVERGRAKLFAETLETPGGLKVQTIHAFCTRLLQQFPFEANVAARFQVAGRNAAEANAGRHPHERSARCRRRLRQPGGPGAGNDSITLASDFAFQQALPEAIREHRRITDWLDHAGGVNGAMADLSRALGIGAEETSDRHQPGAVRRTTIPIADGRR